MRQFPADMDETLKALIDDINKTDRLRVWSVIITFFGDAIIPRGGAVSVRTVQEIMARLGLEDGAVRTAFSRLAQDGWVVREKIGRASFYHLSESGLAPYKKAAREIYAPCPSDTVGSENWLLGLYQQPSKLPVLIEEPTDNDFTELEREDCLLVSGTLHTVPEWVKSRFAPPETARKYHQLIGSFAILKDWQPDPVDAMAARCLLIHEWRRLRLRHPRVPPKLRPEDWPEDTCLDLVSQLYQALLPASETWLSEHATGPDGPLPLPDRTVEHRFGQNVTK